MQSSQRHTTLPNVMFNPSEAAAQALFLSPSSELTCTKKGLDAFDWHAQTLSRGLDIPVIVKACIPTPETERAAMTGVLCQRKLSAAFGR